MSVQIIERDGQPEYAVLPWEEYQALLLAAGQQPAAQPQVATAPKPEFSLQDVQLRREALGLSAAELARDVGISPHYLAMIESGERQPDGAILHALARALGKREADR